MENEFWDREELYVEVWDNPLIKIAAKYGVSAVALGKVCRKLLIPLPGRGYWTKKEFGKPVERIPLPAAKELSLVRRIKSASARSEHDNQNLVETDPNDPELVRIGAIEASIIRIDLEMKTHKLVSSARRILRHCRTDDRGILSPPHNEPCLEIRVSKSSLDRGLQLMNAIIITLQKEGFQVLVGPGRERTQAEIFGQRIPFFMAEKAKVKSRQEVQEYSWKRTIYQYEPKGELEFRIGGYAHGLTQCWRDGKKQKLETMVGTIVGGLMRVARRLRTEDELRKQRELERQAKQQELAALAVQINEEEQKVRNLEMWVTEWDRAEKMRRFVVALEKVWSEQGHDLSPGSQKGERIKWMKELADRVDPMLPSPPSVLDRKAELSRW